MKTIMSIVGARPQFIKLFPVNSALASHEIRHTIVHTGQHYEAQMSEFFFHEFNLPKPDFHLGVGSGGHAYQISEMLTRIDKVLYSINPNVVLVYGDTNSTLAACLSAVRMRLPVAHIEAGLRSYDRSMPEEQNRVVVDHLSNYLFAPTQTSMRNLNVEGLSARSVFVGDVMFDVSLKYREKLGKNESLRKIEQLSQGKPYFLATIHRASNTDSRERIIEILHALNNLNERVILPVHPRLRESFQRFQLKLDFPNIVLVPPQSYLEISELISGCKGVVTDSGGLQKEAFFAQRQCFTVRNSTEWPETLEGGWNTLVSEIEDLASIVSKAQPPSIQQSLFGKGDAALQIVELIKSKLDSNI